MKCDPNVNLLSRESHERFAFITVKQFQVYFRPLQKPSRKWIQSISPRRVTFTWKPWKICFYQSDFKFIFARFRNRAASEYKQFRRLASMLRTSSVKLHVLPVYHFLWSAVRLFNYFLEELVKRQAHYFLDSFESPCSTRKTRNPTRSSMLDPREDRGSSLDPRLKRDCQLTLARYCKPGMFFTLVKDIMSDMILILSPIYLPFTYPVWLELMIVGVTFSSIVGVSRTWVFFF